MTQDIPVFPTRAEPAPDTPDARFHACLAETLKWEGGWSNHKLDPGGATMNGVIQRVYDAWRERGGKPRQSVRGISDAELTAIYDANYWRMVAGDLLPAGLDLAVFDFGVNSGPARAVRYLQSCLGIIQDGHMGPVTINAANRADTRELIAAYMTARQKALPILFIVPILSPVSRERLDLAPWGSARQSDSRRRGSLSPQGALAARASN